MYAGEVRRRRTWKVTSTSRMELWTEHTSSRRRSRSISGCRRPRTTGGTDATRAAAVPAEAEAMVMGAIITTTTGGDHARTQPPCQTSKVEVKAATLSSLVQGAHDLNKVDTNPPDAMRQHLAQSQSPPTQSIATSPPSPLTLAAPSGARTQRTHASRRSWPRRLV